MSLDKLAALDLCDLRRPDITSGGAAKNDKVLHIDGDYLAYFCAGNDDTPTGIARETLLENVEIAMGMSGCRKAVMHLSHRATNKAHRYAIATVKPYQGNRGGKAHPKNWEFLRNLMETYDGHEFTPVVWTTREADDAFALLATETDAVLRYRDKDMRMLPGLHLEWESYELVEVPRVSIGASIAAYDVVSASGLQYGTKWFWLQMLHGDTADNIPGLPKMINAAGKEKPVGEVTAKKILEGATNNAEAYQRVAGVYRSYYGDAAYDAMAEQAGLLWLRTDRAASVRNAMRPFPAEPSMMAAFHRLEQRVKESYETDHQYAKAQA